MYTDTKLNLLVKELEKRGVKPTRVTPWEEEHDAEITVGNVSMSIGHDSKDYFMVCIVKGDEFHFRPETNSREQAIAMFLKELGK